MNSRVSDLYAEYRRRPTNDLVDLSYRAWRSFFQRLQAFYSVNDSSTIALTCLAKFVSRDGKIGNNEYPLFLKMTGFDVSEEKFRMFVQRATNRLSDAELKRLISIDSSLKQHCAEFGFAIVAIDGQISIAEEDFLDYLTE